MSKTLNTAETLFRQRLLKAHGLYAGKLDGEWGPKTDAADEAFENAAKVIALEYPATDARTEANIRTLHLKAQAAAREFMQQVSCLRLPVTVKIISGTRTYAEQDLLYAKGRTTGGPKVTNAKGGQSNHNFGIAWDVGIFENGRYLTEGDWYERLAEKLSGRIEALEAGADWRNPDFPHYQLRTGLTITKVRTRFESGDPRYIGEEGGTYL